MTTRSIRVRAETDFPEGGSRFVVETRLGNARTWSIIQVLNSHGAIASWDADVLLALVQGWLEARLKEAGDGQVPLWEGAPKPY